MARQRNKRSGRRAGSFRTCAGCGRRRPRGQTLRLVRDAGGQCRPDPEGRLGGRGLRVCASLACLEEARRRGAPGRWFRAATVLEPQRLAEQLREWAAARVKEDISRGAAGGWMVAGWNEVERALQARRAALVLLAGEDSGQRSAGLRETARRLGMPVHGLSAGDWPAPQPEGGLAPAAVVHRGVAKRLAGLLDLMAGLDSSRLSLTGPAQAEMINSHRSGGGRGAR